MVAANLNFLAWGSTMQKNTPVKLIPDTELAERWDKSRRTLANWRCLGKGPEYVRIGARIYYTEEGVERFIERQLVQPEQEA